MLTKDLDENGNAGDVDFEARTSANPPRLVVGCSGDAGPCESTDAGDAGSSSDAGNANDAGGSGTDARAEASVDAGVDSGSGVDSGPFCTPESCDDHDPCSTDTCTASGCQHAAAVDGTTCSLGFCTVGDRCVAGTCVAGTAVPVDDANACTLDSCDPTLGVLHTPSPASSPCPDATRCNGDEVCDGAGSCVAGTAPVIDDHNPCTDDACDAALGVTHTPRPAGDLACSDANSCNGAIPPPFKARKFRSRRALRLSAA